jgi:dipeptidase E
MEQRQPGDRRELFLLSNSFVPGMGLLEHALEAIEQLLDGRDSVLFIGFASSAPDLYFRAMSEALAALRVRVEAAPRSDEVGAAIARAEAVFVGGGNSFRLLATLQQLDALDTLRAVACRGTPYLAASAGSILACPTIRTTNDMPIVEPQSFDALGLVPFQINAHYVDPDPISPLRLETRPQRIEQFLEDNDVPVLAIREGSWIRVSDDTASLSGLTSGRLFTRGVEAADIPPGSDLSRLLTTQTRFDVNQIDGSPKS